MLLKKTRKKNQNHFGWERRKLLAKKPELLQEKLLVQRKKKLFAKNDMKKKIKNSKRTLNGPLHLIWLIVSSFISGSLEFTW